MTPEAEEVLDDLRFGTRKIADLASVHAWPRRTVEACLQELRIEGHPIVTDGTGVRLAVTAEEIAACRESLRHRLVSQYRTYKALQRTERRMRLAEEHVEAPTLWDVA